MKFGYQSNASYREAYSILTDASRNSRYKGTHFDSYDKAHFGILGAYGDVEKFQELPAASLLRRGKVCQEAAETKARRRIYRLRILIGRSAVRRYNLYRVCRANSEDSRSSTKVIRQRDTPIATTNSTPRDRIAIHSSFSSYSSFTLIKNESNIIYMSV